jgi:PTH1 family peptidyl-tRNA hydrolase
VKLIVGLGNPGRDYAATRHNAGWLLLDHLAEEWKFDPWQKDFDALVTSRKLDGILVRLLKPTTYMNLSGAAIQPYLRRPTFNAATDLLIIVDEVALPLGSFRIRASGSAGGHNGLKSIESAVGSAEYARLRIGIRPDEAPPGELLADFVLSSLSKAERTALAELLPELRASVDTWIHKGVLAAMNAHNRKKKKPPEESD